MNKRHQIFASSTYADLEEKHQKVVQALKEMEEELAISESQASERMPPPELVTAEERQSIRKLLAVFWAVMILLFIFFQPTGFLPWFLVLFVGVPQIVVVVKETWWP